MKTLKSLGAAVLPRLTQKSTIFGLLMGLATVLNVAVSADHVDTLSNAVSALASVGLVWVNEAPK